MATIQLTQQEIDLVKKILKNRPDAVIFGSRVKGKAQRFSDLDICLKEPISAVDYELLKEQFEESDLVFTVDLVEYNRTNEAFKKIIETDGIKVTSL